MVSPAHERGTPALPWRDIARWALLGTIVICLWVFIDVQRSGRNALNFIQPGADGPSARVFREDFPEVQLPSGLGLDGQQFYAIARNPTHPMEVAPLLDRPRYRLQRPLLAWFAWLLHPTGGGYGLVAAFVIVGVAAIFAGALATGALAVLLGGRPWLAAVFALTPGAWFSLRASGADALALALALAAVALAHRARLLPAIVCAIGAVLAKEVIIVVIVGWAMWRRSRAAFIFAVTPAVVVILWLLALRVIIPSSDEHIGELVAPFVGWRDALAHQWWHRHELVGMATAIASATVGTAALVRRGFSHPLGWSIALSLLLAAVSNGDVIGNNYGSTRSMMPVLVLGIVTLATPGHPVRVDSSSGHIATGMVGPGRGSTGESKR
ncbi:MAG: hypothetical protein QOD92_3542 [Acidimicrobiaceae bacterium]|jgi:hypothetical protein